MKVKVLSGDHAVAYAVKMCNVDVIPNYPITPQTLIIEKLSDFVFDGECDATFMPADSEHSAMSMAIGAAATGVRTFTATASQGLALMHEMLYVAPQTRLPIVMANVNRSLGAGSGIWAEYNDSMPERESGWMQCYVEDSQEAFDTIVQAYRSVRGPARHAPVDDVPGRLRAVAHGGEGAPAGAGGGGRLPAPLPTVELP